MTLLELLVKELPKRGGWPDNDTDYVSQDRNGSVWSYSLKPVLKNETWNSEESMSASNMFDSDKICFDWDKTIITRKQYMESLNPEWNGEGLPPVGVTCEAKYNYASSAEWFVFECVGVSNGIAFGFAAGAAVHLLGSEFTFRTETDHKRESAINALISLGVFTRPVAEKTIDAIAAGKIPGVKLIDVNVNKRGLVNE